MRGSSILGAVALAVLMLTASGCAKRPNTVPFEQILDEYRAKNSALQKASDGKDTSGIRQFSSRTSGDQTLVSADLDNAATAAVVARIADAAGLQYVNAGHMIAGRTTARLRDVPAVDALALVLQEQGLAVQQDGNKVLITLAPRTRELATAELVLNDTNGDGIVDTPYLFTLTALGADDAITLLDRFFASDISNGTFSFAADPVANAVYLKGRDLDVRHAIAMLNQADQPAQHVFIEALVVEINNELVTDFGSKLSGGAIGDFFDVMLDAASSDSSFSFAFDSSVSASSQSFALAMNILEEHSVARVLSRPYLTTTSGKPATLRITEDRFVESRVNEDVDINEVNSGISLTVMPIVTARGSILTKFSVNESRFASVEEDVAVRRTTNAVDSSAAVVSGQTIVIGGLSLQTRAATNAGLPGLTKAPVLGHQSQLHENTEVMIFLTPRIWTPGMDVPVSSEAVMRERNRDDAGSEHANEQK